MKFQINVQATMINSSLVSDKDLAKSMKLQKNEGVAFDVQGLAAQIAAELAERLPQAAKRSKGGNLTVAIPLKVEGSFLTKVDLSAPSSKATAKKTDDEKRASLLQDLGLGL